MDCVFCKILNKEIPGEVEEITSNWATLVPKEQVSRGHILVIPTSHCESILDLDDSETKKELGEALNKISMQQIEKHKAGGINILNANKKVAQQSVPHLHFHIIPRYKGDNLDLWIREKL